MCELSWITFFYSIASRARSIYLSIPFFLFTYSKGAQKLAREENCCKLRKNDLTDRGLWYRVAFTYSYKWTLSPWVCCCYFYHYNDNVEGWLVHRNIMSLLPTFWLSSALVIKIDSSGQISQSNVNKTYWSFFNEGRFTKELGWKWWIGFPLSSTCRSSL